MAYARRGSTMGRRKRTTRARTFTRPARKALPYKYKKALSRTVKRIVSTGREKNYAALVVKPTTIPAQIGQNQTLNVFPVCPDIAQGTSGRGERIGNSVQPTYMTIKGYCTLDMTDENYDYDRVCVRLFLGNDRQYPLYIDSINSISASPLANWTYELLDGGTAPQAFKGDLNSLQSPVNKNRFKCMGERRFTLHRPRIWNAIASSDDFARSTSGSYKFFQFRVPVPKNFKYNDRTSVRCTNFQPTLLAGYTILNGNLPADPATGPKQVTISYTTRLSYTDA